MFNRRHNNDGKDDDDDDDDDDGEHILGDGYHQNNKDLWAAMIHEKATAVAAVTTGATLLTRETTAAKALRGTT
ncbi:hypothetical protein PoB_002237300 [Plakobranchus ocellatus]|uniref:Uncharacterized protein n=1 Tax=Plakobranchus ocellatus TaxID=259542 RepID=A0AAV3ZLZ8_9GAST|nr:hypothetical protein PoB_002237300 [Plakobranchus ocellatus]